EIEHVGAKQVRRHKIGSALNTLKTDIQRARQRLHAQRFAQTGNSLYQRMSSAEQGNQCSIDKLALPDDDLRQLGAAMRYHFRNRLHADQFLSLEFFAMLFFLLAFTGPIASMASFRAPT